MCSVCVQVCHSCDVWQLSLFSQTQICRLTQNHKTASDWLYRRRRKRRSRKRQKSMASTLCCVKDSKQQCAAWLSAGAQRCDGNPSKSANHQKDDSTKTPWVLKQDKAFAAKTKNSSLLPTPAAPTLWPRRQWLGTNWEGAPVRAQPQQMQITTFKQHHRQNTKAED